MELELIDRERRLVERRIKQAGFPVVKQLESFDFKAIPGLNKMLVLGSRARRLHRPPGECDPARPERRREDACRSRRHCQTNQAGPEEPAIKAYSGCKLTPLGQGGGSALFENVAAIEMALVVEMVVDRGMDGGEFLQGLYVSEPSHCPFPPSKGLM